MHFFFLSKMFIFIFVSTCLFIWEEIVMAFFKCCICREEISRYKGLDPTKRLLILKALCEIRADVLYPISTFKDISYIAFLFLPCFFVSSPWKIIVLVLQQNDTVAYINNALKEGTDISAFRKERIGEDGNDTSFW